MGRPLYFCLVVSPIFCLLFLLSFSSPNLSGRRFDVTWCGLSANLECRSEMSEMKGLHAARWEYKTQKWCQKSPSRHHRTTLSGYIFATKAHIDNRKKLVEQQCLPHICPRNMVNFGLLAAEIRWRVWGTPANFNGFCVFIALLHSTLVVGVSQTAALNRGRHLYSAGGHHDGHWPTFLVFLFQPVSFFFFFLA